MRSALFPSLVIALLFAVAPRAASAQHSDLDIQLVDGQLSVGGSLFEGNLREFDARGDGTLWITDNPGFIASGFAFQDEFEFDTVTPLLRWDGSAWRAAEAETETINISHGVLPLSVDVNGSSLVQAGFRFARASTVGTIHKHMPFGLSRADGEPPRLGVYAYAQFLHSPQHLPSEAYYYVFANGATPDELSSARAALAESLWLPGDITGDRRVDLGDFGILKQNFGAAGRRWEGDLGGDGQIDLSDFGQLKENFGVAPVAAPEPAGWILSILAAVCLVVARAKRPRSPQLVIALSMACLLTGGDSARAQSKRPVPDLSKLERRLEKQPQYVGQPLFGLIALGESAQTHLWFALDRSHPDVSGYDVLYFDRDADGDLTQPQDRLTGRREHGDTSSHVFKIGDVRDPRSREVHRFEDIMAFDDGRTSVGLFWQGRHLVRCGFDVGPKTEHHLGLRPEEAPVYWPGLEEPLHFQQYVPWRQLARGAAHDLSLLVGHRGQGPASFSAAATEKVLPEGVPIHATLRSPQPDGAVRVVSKDLVGRGCGLICFGYFPLPADFPLGPAVARFEVDQHHGWRIEPFEVPVEITETNSSASKEDR